MKKRVFNLIIVDESGSMYCIERQTVNGMNETLQSIRYTQKTYPEMESYVSLMTFSSDRIRMIYNCTSAVEAADINPNDYNPGGCTPLYDAIGRGVEEMKKMVAPADKVIVTILTDGEENSSKEFNHRSIHHLIEEQKKKDWIFSFIGANIDVERTSRDLGISFCLKFDQTEKETPEMFEKVNKMRDSLMCCYMENKDLSMKEAAKKSGYFDSKSEEKKTKD